MEDTGLFLARRSDVDNEQDLDNGVAQVKYSENSLVRWETYAVSHSAINHRFYRVGWMAGSWLPLAKHAHARFLVLLPRLNGGRNGTVGDAHNLIITTPNSPWRRRIGEITTSGSRHNVNHFVAQ